ncbi:MAG: DUF3090 family protein [Actinobacteria bacterium]|nr:DUF3090 family protein [Actinomycetota bacterium]
MSDGAEFGEADRLAVGAFGEPGQRVFLLQIGQGERVLTVKVEKGQVTELVASLERVMADRPLDSSPDRTAARLADHAEPEWVVGSIRLGYDSRTERVALVLEEFRGEVAQDDDEPATALILISPQQVAALVAEVSDLVAAGRPSCDLCGYPLDPSGHVCPKTNGHRPPKL